MSLKQKLKDWTDIENTLVTIGKCVGIYDELVELKNIPKYVFWSNSDENKEVEALNNILQILIQLGAVEERNGGYDYEYRWNNDFQINWEKLLLDGKK